MKTGSVLSIVVLGLMLSGCWKTPPEVNKTATAKSARVLEYKHSVYIPVREDNEKGQLGALLQDVDTWIDTNQNKEVVTVTMINATQEDSIGGYSHTTVSGALIIFRPK